MSARAKAIAILERAAASRADSDRHYADVAQELGFDVRYIPPSADDKYGGGEGADMDAVEMAAEAWCRAGDTVPEVNDPRRDAEAARMLREEQS